MIDEKDLPQAEFIDHDEQEEQWDSKDLAVSQESLPNELGSEAAKGVSPKILQLRKMGRESQLPSKSRIKFQAAVELDEMRLPEDRMGLLPLFEVCCQKGTPYWLNPLEDLKPIVENLGKFNGTPAALKPFIFLLLQIARAGLSPASLVTYVLRPRMAFDSVWRAWRESHYWSLNAVVELLIEMKKFPPFNETYLGKTKIRTEVALVKFVGRPLFRYPARALENPTQIKNYEKAWRSFQFNNLAFINFIRVNFFPFLYRLSGRVDLEQLVPIIRECQTLEPEFLRVFPQDDPPGDLFSVNLSQDLETRLVQKEKDGLGALDILRELKDYLRLVKNLLKTPNGIYLGSFFATLFRNLQDQETPALLGDLVLMVKDTGGLAALRWHGAELVRRPLPERRIFLLEIRNGEGFHPFYPYKRPEDLYSWSETIQGPLADLTLSLGLDPKNLKKGIGTIRENFFLRYPVQEGLWDKVKNSVWDLKDKSWTPDFWGSLDTPGQGGHQLLLRTLMPGLGQSIWAKGTKSQSFSELFRLYGGVAQLSCPEVKRDFILKLPPPWAFDQPLEDAVRTRLNIEPVVTIMEWKKGSQYPLSDFSSQIFQKIKEIEKVQNQIREQIINLEIEGLEGEKKQKALALQLSNWKKVMEVLPDLNESQTLVLLLWVAAKTGKSKDPLMSLAFNQVLSRYGQTEEIKAKEDYLAADIPLGKMTLQHWEFFLNWLESLSIQLQNNLVISKPGDDFKLAAQGFSPLSREEFGPPALEAAFKKISGYSKIAAETAKGKDLYGKLVEGELPQGRYRVGLSKAPLDAYFGDMGGICLSDFPKLILRPGFFNLRFLSEATKEILGIGLLAYGNQGIRSLGVESFFYFFGFNFLRSFLTGLSQRNWLVIYLNFRALLEELSKRTGKPIFLTGTQTTGILSNNQELADLVRNYEKRRNPPQASDAQGFNVYYPAADFAKGWLIIDPKKKDTFFAQIDLENLT